MKIKANQFNELYGTINDSVVAAETDTAFYNSKRFVSNSEIKEMLANIDTLVSSYIDANRNGFDKTKLLNSSDKRCFQTQQGYLFASRSNREIPLYCFVERNDLISDVNEEHGLTTFKSDVNKLQVNVTFVFRNEDTFNSFEIETNTKLESLNDGTLSYDVVSESLKQELLIADTRMSKIKLTVNAKKGFNFLSLAALTHSIVRSTELIFDLPETSKFYIEIEKDPSLVVSLYLEDNGSKLLIGSNYQDPIELVVNPVNNVFELPLPIKSMELYEEGTLLQEAVHYSFRLNTVTYLRADLLPDMNEGDSLTVIMNSSNPTKIYFCRFVVNGNSWKGIGFKNKTTSVSTKGKKLLMSITNVGSGFEQIPYFSKPIIWYKS